MPKKTTNSKKGKPPAAVGLDEPGLKVIEAGNFSLPAAPDAERGLLAMCLEAPREAIVGTLERLGSEGARAVFYDPAHGLIWEALRGLFDEGAGDGGGIDLITLTERLRSMGKLDEVGGPAAIAALVEMNALGVRFSPGWLHHYTEILLEKWQQRETWQVGRRLSEIGVQDFAGDRAGLVSGLLGQLGNLGRVRDRLLGLVRRSGAGSGSVSEVVKAIRQGRKARDWAPVWVVCDADEKRAKQTIVALEECAGEGMAITRSDLDTLWNDETSGLYQALTDAWVVLVWGEEGAESSASAGGGGDLPPPEVMGWVRMVRECAGKVTTLCVSATWPGRSDLGTVLREMASAKMEPPEVQRQLWGEAENGHVPEVLWYEGYWGEGPKGGLKIYEDLLSERLVKRERLIWSGGDFWQWGSPDGSRGTAGVWQRMPMSELRAEQLVRGVMRMDKAPREAIEQRRVRSIVGLMKSTRFAEADGWNGGDGMWINTRSGMLHALTRELRPHAEGHLSTVQIPVSYDERARCDRWLEWLEGRLPEPEVRRQLQEIFGYCVVPAVNYHKFFFWYGDGGTGKSTATRVLEWLVGLENRVSVQPEDLDNETIRASLVGRTLYVCPEVTPRSFRHMDVIKAIVSGDPVQVRKLYQDPFTFVPKGRLLMTSNVVACTNDVTEGFGRRFLQMNWEQVIAEKDKVYGFEDQVLRPEMGGILLWALEGFSRLHERGRFEHTNASQRHLDELMMHRDQAHMFMNDREWVEVLPSYDAGEAALSDLWDAFTEWCEVKGVNRFTDDQGAFSREAGKRDKELAVRRRRVHRLNSTGGSYKETVFRGLRVRSEHERERDQEGGSDA